MPMKRTIVMSTLVIETSATIGVATAKQAMKDRPLSGPLHRPSGGSKAISTSMA
jgi:hypothetical protein